jgi:four helix bundle protein
MAFAFEKLLVYQKAVDFSDRISELSGSFPRGFYFLTDQINRAALSISTNIAHAPSTRDKAREATKQSIVHFPSSARP